MATELRHPRFILPGQPLFKRGDIVHLDDDYMPADEFILVITAEIGWYRTWTRCTCLFQDGSLGTITLDDQLEWVARLPEGAL
jgi:hypothetical protein